VVDSPPEGALQPDGISFVGHAHHWLIGRQDGPASEGVCKWCGARRDFNNGYRYAAPAWAPASARTQRSD